MVHTPWRHPPLTKDQQDDLFMLLLSDDTGAVLVRGGDASHYLRVAGRREQEDAPATFVSFVLERARTSYDLAIEGMFPPFVLEVEGVS